MTSLWNRPATPEDVNARLAGTAAAVVGVRVTEIRDDALVAEMAVGPQHLQPHGILHGGVSVLLAETIGTVACVLTLPEGRRAVGIEVNANHLAAVAPGQVVTALCRPFHTGRRTQVWQTEIRRADGRLACVSRLTCAVLEAGE